MQINRIEVRLGVTVNAGDFQSVKSEMMASADIDRNEDPIAAHAELTAFVRKALVDGTNASHPDQVRKMLTADARLVEAAAQNADGKTKATKGKGKTAGKPAEPAIGSAIPDDLGGLDKEAELDQKPSDDGLNELDDLLGDTPAEAVTKEQVHEALVTLNKKGGKMAVLQILKQFGVGNLSQLPEAKYADAKAACDKLASEIKG